MAVRIPSMPKLLGFAGLLPQIAFCAAAWAGPSEWREAAMVGALAYAALIFTFLGGTWWGMAATAPAAEGRGALGWVWIAAVLPSLIALAVILAALGGLSLPGREPVASALLVLGPLIGASTLVDSLLSPGGRPAIAPAWWPRLRWPLSLGLGALTVATALAL